MVVSCPNCQKRYHYRVGDHGARDQAQCSHCEGIVPLVEARPVFVVRARVEPVLAASAVPASAAAGAVGSVSGVPYPPAVAPPPSGFTEPSLDEIGVNVADLAGVVPVAEPSSEPFPLQPDSSPPHTDARQRPNDPAEPRVDEDPAPATSVKKSNAWLLLVTVVLVTAVFAAAGHFAEVYGWLWPIEVHPSVDPVPPSLVGGLLGVLLGWIVVRWTSRRS